MSLFRVRMNGVARRIVGKVKKSMGNGQWAMGRAMGNGGGGKRKNYDSDGRAGGPSRYSLLVPEEAGQAPYRKAITLFRTAGTLIRLPL